MVELLRDNLPLVLIAVLFALVVAFLIFRPRQRVRLTDSAPLRPHMPAGRDRPNKANTLASTAATVANAVTEEIVRAPVHRPAAADDLLLLKGVGPKLADLLLERGFTRFEQLAHLTTEEIDLLDQQLGPFAGRIKRDRIVEQAAYLGRGDIDGFEDHFGNL